MTHKATRLQAEASGTMALEAARAWLETDPIGVRSDIERLGPERAAKYNARNARLAADGDPRWMRITVAAMRAAIGDYLFCGR